ncbi:MAG: putrescine aminotransferase, partial [Chloroflexota bacterium]
MDATESEHLYTEIFDKYIRHVNPYLAKLMGFVGFGVEIHGEGSYLYDHEGRALLDCLGGYGTFALGHRHPEILDAVRAQLDSLCISGKAFFSKNQADLAEVLAEVSPPGLEYVFFSNSGGEAVEAALKMAKGATGRPGIVSTQRAYHGKTLGALATAGSEKYRKPF